MVTDSTGWDRALERDGSVTFGVDRAKVARMLAVCLGFTVVGLWFIVAGRALIVVLGVVTVVFFGVVCGSVGLSRLIRGGPAVRVDHGGIRWGRQSIGWSELTDVGVWSGVSPASAMVILTQTPAAAKRNLAAQSVLGRLLAQANRRQLGPEESWLPNTNGFDADLMARWLKDLRARNQPSQGAN